MKVRVEYGDGGEISLFHAVEFEVPDSSGVDGVAEAIDRLIRTTNFRKTFVTAAFLNSDILIGGDASEVVSRLDQDTFEYFYEVFCNRAARDAITPKEDE